MLNLGDIGWDVVALALILLAAGVLSAWFARGKRYRRVRFGVFLERERFPGEDDEADDA